MADNKAKLTLMIEVHDDHITMDMDSSDAFNRLSTDVHLMAM